MTNPVVKKPTPSERRKMADVIHWALIEKRKPITKDDPNDDGYVEMQALHCPWYVPLEGDWGGDWGCIMHPQSAKFGQLVFEHEWCGCGQHLPAFPEQVFGV